MNIQKINGKNTRAITKMNRVRFNSISSINSRGALSLNTAFITEWTVPANTTIVLPLTMGSYTYDFEVNWGDGTSSKITSYNDDDKSHTYTSARTYTVSITGKCEAWSFGTVSTSKNYITKIIQWGNNTFKYLNRGFLDCYNLVAIEDENSISYYGEDLSFLFCHCTNLVNIPDDIFKNCINVTSFQYCFYNDNLSPSNYTSIPENLFQSCTKVKDFSYCFGGLVNVTIPENLFKHNTLVTTFKGCFSYYSTDSLISLFSRNLFKYNTAVIDFSYCFYLAQFEQIPQDIFSYNINVISFTSCFTGNEKLLNAPLFWHNTNVVAFRNCFKHCVNLNLHRVIFSSLSEYATRFALKDVDLTECFYRETNTTLSSSPTPELWNYTFGSVISTDCFAGDGNNSTYLSNYDSIPSSWK